MGDSKMRDVFKVFLLAVMVGLTHYSQGTESRRAEVQQVDMLIDRLENSTQMDREIDGKEQLLTKLRQLRKVINGDNSMVKRGMQGASKDLKVFLSSRAVCMIDDSDKQLLKSYEKQIELVLSGAAPLESLKEFGDRDHNLQYLGSVPTSKLARGDLVFVCNDSVWTKNLVAASTREKRFSHIGIVKECKNLVRLITVGADEITGRGCVSERTFGELNGVAIDLAVYRYSGQNADKVRERIARAAEKRIGTPFDPAFDLKTKDRLYCTEMVRDCVNEAAGHEVIGTSRKGDFEYVAVDDCYRNEMTKVWDCRDQKPEEKQQIQKLQSRPVVIESSSTTNAPVRRTIRFIPKNGGGR